MRDSKKRFDRYPICEALNPRLEGLHNIMKDRYWVVDSDECLLFYTSSGYLSPQCNSNQSIVERLVRSNMEDINAEDSIRFFERVFIPMKSNADSARIPKLEHMRILFNYITSKHW